MTEPVSNARYFPWDGGAVFVGTAGVLPAHAHQAIQLCFLFAGHIRLRPGNSGTWADYDLGLIPSRHPHSMDGLRTHPGATLFIEPETREGRTLTERYLQYGITSLDRTPVEPVVRDLQSAACDERISRAVKYVNEHLSAEQTGMGLRQYILWRRFVSVWEHRMNGVSLSTAAHAAGFADSAHLARTSRRMVGIPPSALEVSPPRE